MIPLSVMLTSVKNRKLLVSYTCLLAGIGITGFIMGILSGDIFNNLVFVYIIGFVLFQWVANFLLIRESNR